MTEVVGYALIGLACMLLIGVYIDGGAWGLIEALAGLLGLGLVGVLAIIAASALILVCRTVAAAVAEWLDL